MDIQFDPDKDDINRQKHGLSLVLAERFDWDTSISWPDKRFDYDEERMSGLGFIDGVLYYIAFVERWDVTRVFSLRLANRKEVEHYVRYYKRR